MFILLCSLIPEDYEISWEELVIYGTGLGLYADAKTIEKARSQMRVMVNHLKAYCLLLDDGNENFVKMHDMVHNVALWIGSKGKKFKRKAGLGLLEESLKQFVVISLMDNKLEVLPNLEISLMEGQQSDCIKFCIILLFLWKSHLFSILFLKKKDRDGISVF